MKVTLLQTVLLAVCLLVAGQTANATWVTIYIEGVVEYVDDKGNYLEGQIQIGTPITGYYIYNTEMPDSSPDDPVQGNYWHYSSPAGVFLSVGGLQFGTNPADVKFHLFIRNDNPSGDDVYGFGSSSNNTLPSGQIVERIWWQLNDYTHTALASDFLIDVPPNLADWQDNVLGIGADRKFGIGGHITSAVPEPATVLPLVCGSVFAAKLYNKKR